MKNNYTFAQPLTGTIRATITLEATGPCAGASDLPRTTHPYCWSPFIIIGPGL